MFPLVTAIRDLVTCSVESYPLPSIHFAYSDAILRVPQAGHLEHFARSLQDAFMRFKCSVVKIDGRHCEKEYSRCAFI